MQKNKLVTVHPLGACLAHPFSQTQEEVLQKQKKQINFFFASGVSLQCDFALCGEREEKNFEDYVGFEVEVEGLKRKKEEIVK